MQNYKAFCTPVDLSMPNELNSKLPATEQELAQTSVILHRKAIENLLNPRKRTLLDIFIDVNIIIRHVGQLRPIFWLRLKQIFR